MDKKKLKADSVDELMEIVRAVQNGEDPDMNKIREEQRKKREEQILERRRKRSGGSADSAGPVRASGKGRKREEKDREEEQEEERKETAREPDDQKKGDAQEDAAKEEEQETEAAAEDFSWPQFDPRKMLAERNAKEDAKESAKPDEKEEPEPDDGAWEEEEEEEPEKEKSGHWKGFREFWNRSSDEGGVWDEDDEDDEPDEDEESEDDESDGEESRDGEKTREEIIREKEEEFDDDEFERFLNEDNTEAEFIKGRETAEALASKVAGLFGKLHRKAERPAAGKGKTAPKKEMWIDEFPDRADEEDSREEAGAGDPGRAPVFDRAQMRRMEQSLIERRRESEDSEDDFTYREMPEDREEREDRKKPEAGNRERYRASDEEDRKKPEAGNRERFRDPDEETRKERAGRSRPEPEQEAKGRRREPDPTEEKQDGKSRKEERTGRKTSGKERQNRSRSGGGRNQKGSRSTRKQPARRGAKTRLPDGVSGLLGEAKGRIQDGWHALNQRGIHKREMAMLLIVLLFIVLILFFTVTAIRNFFSQKQKSRNVTADAGLVITVEDEPKQWTSSYPVRLRISCRTGGISSVMINGTSCTPDENGMITLETGNWRLQAQVETDDGVKTARIEIPMLDGEAPVLDIKQEGDSISLSAADMRSQVEGIYYASEDPDQYPQLPLYKEYKEPIKYEKGLVYRFFAKDKAGNISTPVVTTLEDAESFTLGQTRMSLFPDETGSLSVEASPAGALLRNLEFKSTDTAVASVEKNGKITAVGEGTAEILVSADGMESQTCTVDVSTERSVLVSAIGDCTLGTDESFNASTSFNAFDAVNGHEYFFRNVKDIFEEDDVTFANFEGTLTDSTEREAKQFAFKGDPSYTEILKDGSVEVVTLANNHSKDYGEQSLEDTKEALKEAGIDYCIGDEIVIREVNGVKTAFIGIYVLDIGLEVQSQVAETIIKARQMGAQIVIVAFHWGSEKETVPDETQRSLAHTAIDRGADLVVGHHPHVLQGIELYNGKYIVYSLANFCFGGNSSPSDMDTIIFQQNFTVDQDGTVNSGEPAVIPCRISSESGYNNYQPTPVSGAEAERIIGRLNEYSREFGQTYTAALR